MDARLARIRWLKPEEGGRASPPPGLVYSTVARFQSLAPKWPQEAWSVVIDITGPPDDSGEMLVGFRLLAEDMAPQGLLCGGSRFELFEGRKCVAHGEVVK